MKKTNEFKKIYWLATDKNCEQFIYEQKPKRSNMEWLETTDFHIGKNIFNHTWEDEPIQVELVIKPLR